MAFYSLWKWFSPWSRRFYPNMVYWYSEYILKTPEQRTTEQFERKRRVNTAILQLGIAAHLIHERIGQLYEIK